jgi:tetratricopeptide (TPR) repeat protein
MTIELDPAIQAYISTFLRTDIVQAVEDAETDPQIASIFPLLCELLSQPSIEQLVDIGCGEGVVAARLFDDGIITQNKGPVYVGVDIDERLDKIQALARSRRLNRKVELINLVDFYKEWPYFAGGSIYVCRNVFHELDIEQTATLISHVCTNMTSTDVLLVQDLVTFSQSERHNSCWIPEFFERVFTDIGLSSSGVALQKTRSGNVWLTLTLRKPFHVDGSFETVRQAVINGRLAQWNAWGQPNAAGEATRRAPILEALDIDLQLAALTRQLRNAGALGLVLEPSFEKHLVVRDLGTKVDQAIASGTRPQKTIRERARFRERGEQLSPLEDFLRGDSKLALVSGGAGIGKTSLVEHLLANRSYAKSNIVMNGVRHNELWSFLESFLSQAGVRISPEVFSVISSLEWGLVAEPVVRLVRALAPDTIIFVDDFYGIIDSDGYVADAGLFRLLKAILETKGAKLIIGNRSNQIPGQLATISAPAPVVHVHLGRYARNQTVENILDDHFDRSATGLAEYPSRLLDAIDRHPLMAALAAEILRKNGSAMLDDERFLADLEGKLRDALWRRLIDDQSRPAVEACANLRIAVPRRLLTNLVPDRSVDAAVSDAALYEIFDPRWERLVAALTLFRANNIKTSADEAVTTGSIDHNLISELYLHTYRHDDDPKWIRESYFHKMLASAANGTEIAARYGQYYYSELINSADYAFKRKRDHELALQLYDAAAGIRELPEGARMHRASCLIRINKRQEGEREFELLIDKYANNRNMKTSLVDALIFVRDYTAALEALDEYALSPDESDWIAGQWGRCYLGLGRYSDAEKMFRKQLAKPTASADVYVTLAKALQHQGAIPEAVAILRQGHRRWKESNSILATLGSNLERLREDDDALSILEPLFASSPEYTQAGLALVKLYVRKGNFGEARATTKTAKKYAHPRESLLVSAMEAEVLIGEGRPDLAVAALRSLQMTDESGLGVLVEAYYHWALSKPHGAEQATIANEALATPVAASLKRNAPVLMNRARLAILAKNKTAFDQAMSALRSSKMPSEEIRTLQEKWRLANT